MKQSLHNIRYELDTLYYKLFDSLTGDQRRLFQNIIDQIDHTLKSMEDF